MTETAQEYQARIATEIGEKLKELATTYDSKTLAAMLCVFTARLWNVILTAKMDTSESVAGQLAIMTEIAFAPSKDAPRSMTLDGADRGTRQ